MSNSIHPETRLGPVHLLVRSLARSLVFYEETLGFRRIDGDENTATLAASGGGEPVLRLTGRPDAPARPPRSAGLYHFAILLPERVHLARSLQRLAEQRYPLQGASDHLVSEALYLSDLDGNGIEIYTDRPRDEWPRRNGVLEMTTAALDVEGLLQTLTPDEGPWQGLPAGTRIGHVHLHVGHLSRAEEFYRDVLGLELMQRYGPSAAFLAAGGYHHHVGINTWAGVNVPPVAPGTIGLDYFTIIVPTQDGLDRIAGRLAAADVAVEKHGEGLLTRDPAGNGILLTTQADL